MSRKEELYQSILQRMTMWEDNYWKKKPKNTKQQMERAKMHYFRKELNEFTGLFVGCLSEIVEMKHAKKNEIMLGSSEENGEPITIPYDKISKVGKSLWLDQPAKQWRSLIGDKK